MNAAEGLDEIKVATAYLHSKIAKRDLQSGATYYTSPWVLLAQYLAELSTSFLCDDFIMALFSVPPALRARGFHSKLVVWSCWHN